MKKLFFIVISIFIIFLFFFSFGLTVNNNLIFDNTSQIQVNYFNFICDRYFAEFYCGKRESVFDYDGISTDKVEYGIFRINLYGNNNYAKTLELKTKFNNKEYVYVLEKNPFDGTFMCDIEKIYSEDINIQIYINNIDSSFKQMDCLSKEWNIKYNKALQIGFKESNDFIKNNSKDLYECYLTVIHEKDVVSEKYFWLFEVKTNTLKQKSVIIDVQTGKIIFTN